MESPVLKCVDFLEVMGGVPDLQIFVRSLLCLSFMFDPRDAIALLDDLIEAREVLIKMTKKPISKFNQVLRENACFVIATAPALVLLSCAAAETTKINPAKRYPPTDNMELMYSEQSRPFEVMGAMSEGDVQ